MNTQRNADLSEDQENKRHSKTRKSSVRLAQLAGASLAGALAVYYSYSSSPWRYVPMAALTSVAVFLTIKAIMARSAETEESRTHKKIDFEKLIIIDSVNKEHMYRILDKEITRIFERERSRDFPREYNFREQDFISRINIEQILVRNIREPYFVSRIDGQTQMIHELNYIDLLLESQ